MCSSDLAACERRLQRKKKQVYLKKEYLNERGLPDRPPLRSQRRESAGGPARGLPTLSRGLRLRRAVCRPAGPLLLRAQGLSIC